MPSKITASASRQNLADIINRAAYGGERTIVHRRKRPMAAVVPLWQLENRAGRREHAFEKVQAVWRSTAKIRPSVIEHEVEEAVQASRARSRSKKK